MKLLTLITLGVLLALNAGRACAQPLGQMAIDVRDFGAKCDGTDDTTAITKAVTALGANGGVVTFPRGNCLVTTALNVDDKRGVILRGMGGRSGGATTATHLTFSSGGSASLLSARSTTSFAMEDIRVAYTNAAFTGSLVDLRHSATGGDSALERFRNVFFEGVVAAGQTAILLNLDKAIEVSIIESQFSGGDIAIYGASAGSYSNVIQVRACQLQNQNTAPIKNPDEAWLVEANTFNARRDGTQAAVWSDAGNRVLGFNFLGNWLGDLTTCSATTGWIELGGSGISIIGNQLGGCATTTAVKITENNSSGTIAGNSFVSHSKALDFGATTGNNFSESGNTYTSVTTPLAGESGNLGFRAVTFANLGTPANGTIRYCSDCDPAVAIFGVCTSAGTKTGAFAKRLNGAWICG